MQAANGLVNQLIILFSNDAYGVEFICHWLKNIQLKVRLSINIICSLPLNGYESNFAYEFSDSVLLAL